MSTYVLMRILESAPRRYELGMRLLTLGRVDRSYDRLASHVAARERVLDLGCGTGALAVRAARRGALVRAVDISAEMLEIAERRVRDAGLEKSIELAEMGVAELDSEPEDHYDAVTSGLCLSELSPDELDYALGQIARILRPGGLLLVADELRSRTRAGRLTQALLRAPLVALTWLVTQQTTRPVPDLAERLRAVGLVVLSLESSALSGFAEIVARKPAESS